MLKICLKIKNTYIIYLLFTASQALGGMLYHLKKKKKKDRNAKAGLLRKVTTY